LTNPVLFDPHGLDWSKVCYVDFQRNWTASARSRSRRPAPVREGRLCVIYALHLYAPRITSSLSLPHRPRWRLQAQAKQRALLHVRSMPSLFLDLLPSPPHTLARAKYHPVQPFPPSICPLTLLDPSPSGSPSPLIRSVCRDPNQPATPSGITRYPRRLTQRRRYSLSRARRHVGRSRN